MPVKIIRRTPVEVKSEADTPPWREEDQAPPRPIYPSHPEDVEDVRRPAAMIDAPTDSLPAYKTLMEWVSSVDKDLILVRKTTGEEFKVIAYDTEDHRIKLLPVGKQQAFMSRFTEREDQFYYAGFRGL